jgi:hypothetical protein
MEFNMIRKNKKIEKKKTSVSINADVSVFGPIK